MDAITVALVFACGVSTGYLVRSWLFKIEFEIDTVLYGSPSAAYWVKRRSLETDKYWLDMPLDEYTKERALMRREDNT